MKLTGRLLPCRHASLFYATLPGERSKPVALILPGALCVVEQLAHVAPVFATDFHPVLVDLPGHGRSTAPAQVTLDAFADDLVFLVETLFPQAPLVLVGESFGGIVGLAVAARLRGLRLLVVVDPPLTTAKQWHVHPAFHKARQRRPHDPFLHHFARELFGLSGEGVAVAERVYYPLVEKSMAPVLVITGDEPLLPPRRGERVPCCIDATDRFVLEQCLASKVTLRQAPQCGHVVLRERPEQCLAWIREAWGAVPVIARDDAVC